MRKINLSTVRLAAVCLLLSLAFRAGAQEQPGDWDGATSSAELSTPYVNPVAADVPFGIISYYNNPWRSYLDTWPARRYNEALGVNWNPPSSLPASRYDALCQMLSESGITTCRIEIPWGSLGWGNVYTDAQAGRTKQAVLAMQKWGIRPLFLLNANHGLPCPVQTSLLFLAASPAGSRTMTAIAGDLSMIVAGQTGLSCNSHYGFPGYGNGGVDAYPLVTKVQGHTLTLSAPLPARVNLGIHCFDILEFKPFSLGATGTRADRAATFAGWQQYVMAVCGYWSKTLGTAGTSDAGFDVENWNEVSFGSNFLDEGNYYSPQRAKIGIPSATAAPAGGYAITKTGVDVLLTLTVAAAGHSPGVRVIDGMSNERPWDSGATLWPGQAGFSRHYYTGGTIDVSPSSPAGNSLTWATTDLFGNDTGIRTWLDFATIVRGSGFIPSFSYSFPEFWWSGLKTEGAWRDTWPFISTTSGNVPHGRFVHEAGLDPAEIWMTECGWWRTPFMQSVQDSGTSSQMAALDRWMAAKASLRSYVFQTHKGLNKTVLYCLWDGGSPTEGFGLVPASWAGSLPTNGGLTDVQRATEAPLWKALKWVHGLMSSGQDLAVLQPLGVQSLTEYQPRLLFKGNGTSSLPDQHYRDVFGFFPFQLDSRRFAIPYYVVTPDITHVYDSGKAAFDHTRYDLPPQQYDVVIGNVAGAGASVSAYDPLTQSSVPVSIVSSTSNTLTVRLRATDYPRWLMVSQGTDANGIIRIPQ